MRHFQRDANRFVNARLLTIIRRAAGRTRRTHKPVDGLTHRDGRRGTSSRPRGDVSEERTDRNRIHINEKRQPQGMACVVDDGQPRALGITTSGRRDHVSAETDVTNRSSDGGLGGRRPQRIDHQTHALVRAGVRGGRRGRSGRRLSTLGVLRGRQRFRHRSGRRAAVARSDDRSHVRASLDLRSRRASKCLERVTRSVKIREVAVGHQAHIAIAAVRRLDEPPL